MLPSFPPFCLHPSLRNTSSGGKRFHMQWQNTGRKERKTETTACFCTSAEPWSTGRLIQLPAVPVSSKQRRKPRRRPHEPAGGGHEHQRAMEKKESDLGSVSARRQGAGQRVLAHRVGLVLQGAVHGAGRAGAVQLQDGLWGTEHGLQ